MSPSKIVGKNCIFCNEFGLYGWQNIAVIKQQFILIRHEIVYLYELEGETLFICVLSFNLRKVYPM